MSTALLFVITVKKLNLMKRLFTILSLVLIYYNVCAQKTLFVRIYDLNGKKINKGHVLAITDTSLLLNTKGGHKINIPINSFTTIKTKRSAGHNLLIGSLALMVPLAIVGAASGSPNDTGFLSFTAAEGVGAGALVGIPIGAAIGGISVLLKGSKTFVINGQIDKWRVFQLYIAEKNK